MNAQNNRKDSAGQSHHTYASIGSDIAHYESLSGRRGTKEGYDFPKPAVSIKKGTKEGYDFPKPAISIKKGTPIPRPVVGRLLYPNFDIFPLLRLFVLLTYLYQYN